MNAKGKLHSIQELCSDIVGGGTPSTKVSSYWNGDIPWISSADISELGYIDVRRYITKEAIQKSPTNLVPKGTVIVVSRVGVGKAAIAPFDLCFSQDCQGLILKNELVSEGYFIKAIQKSLGLLTKKARGATITGVTKDEIKKLTIHVPTLQDQIRIANILSKAEALISHRKESLLLLDEFLKSTFLEMFGDPVRNEKGWDKARLGNFIENIIAGSSYGGEQKENLEVDELGVLKVSAVTWGVFNPKEFKAIKKKDITGKIVNPVKGDLLFSRANTKELVGATCIVNADYPRLFLPDKIWNIKLNENEVDKYYLHFLLQNNDFKNVLTRDATGTSSSMLNISMEKLRNLNFPKPPLILQTKFAHIVEKTESLKAHNQSSLHELENLYGSLSQRAFKGELNVKGAVLLMAAEPSEQYGK